VAAAGREISVVNLAERPSASRAPVKSIPAILAIASNGSLQAAHAGVISESEIAETVGWLSRPRPPGLAATG
jgi:hypothetical protein